MDFISLILLPLVVSVVLLGASRTSTSALLYASYRYALHKGIPATTLRSKTKRAALAGALTGASIGLGKPTRKGACALRFALVGSGKYLVFAFLLGGTLRGMHRLTLKEAVC